MSAVTHFVEVLDKQDRVVRLRLYIVHPDEDWFCVAKNCALQILWDQVHPAFGVQSALGDVMSVNDRLSARWLLENQDRFIASATLLETKNYPASPRLNFNKHMKNKRALPQGIVEIEVTDPKWVEQVQPGDTWETSPFDAEGYV
jgi:hypothetical protein